MRGVQTVRAAQCAAPEAGTGAGARAAAARPPPRRHAPPAADAPAHPSWAAEPPPLLLPTQQAACAAPLLLHGAGAATLLAARGAAPPALRVQLEEGPPPPRGPAEEEERRRQQDYYANVGDAIRTLREDIPALFARAPDFTIYREDVVFTQSSLRFTGLKAYRAIFWSLRFHGRLFFDAAAVEVLRIWQPDEGQIKMRWQVRARPRVARRGAAALFDGVSTYKLDREGRIYEHAVDNVQLRDPPIANPLLYGLNYILGPAYQPQMPVPGSWCRSAGELLAGGGGAVGGGGGGDTPAEPAAG